MSAKKSSLLGENFSTAANKLRKNLLFSLAQKLGLDICFRCGDLIEDAKSLSIEHKEAWQSAADPNAAFYDLDNIAFSHLKCNIGAANSARTYPDLCPLGHKNWRLSHYGYRECRTCLAAYKSKWRKENNRR